MSIKEMKINRWSGDIWHKGTRYLNSNLGKPWAQLHSHLCGVADIRTHTGQEIRRFIDREVDDKGKYTGSHKDWYVDERGCLQAYPKHSYRSVWQQRKENAPIQRIYFKDDGPNVWYEELTVPEYPVEKHIKQHKLWYRTVRSIEVYTIPYDEAEAARMKVGLKKGKKDFYREVSRETFQRTQIGGKVLDLVRTIVARKTPRGHKILKLAYAYNSAKDKHTMTAYVSGQSV